MRDMSECGLTDVCLISGLVTILQSVCLEGMLCAGLLLLSVCWVIDSLVYLGALASSGSHRRQKHHEHRQAHATLVLRGGSHTHIHNETGTQLQRGCSIQKSMYSIFT